MTDSLEVCEVRAGRKDCHRGVVEYGGERAATRGFAFPDGRARNREAQTRWVW
ncbi:hypothetical protein CGRA01v4_00278 [Colletotrichum graminicola]|nr:hypothetical protein CGRA01v4_00278 [Colletotrichum graminicola]